MAIVHPVLPGVLTIVQFGVSAYAIASTVRGSYLRSAMISCLIMLCCIDLVTKSQLEANLHLKCVVRFFTLIKFLHFIALFGVLDVDMNDVQDPGPNISNSIVPRRFHTALRLVTSTRCIGTKWEITGLLPASNIFILGGSNQRGRFLIRQVSIIAWQYLAIDLLYILWRDMQRTSSHLYNPGTDFLGAGTTAAQAITRVVLITIFAPLIIIYMDVLHRVLSVVGVSTGMTQWEDWPPIFGNLQNAYTVQKFWGQVSLKLYSTSQASNV